MNDYSNKSVLIYTPGLFEHLAFRLARDFGRVQLFVPWKGAAPHPNALAVGSGYEDDGIERVRDFFDAVPSADLICYDDQTEVLTDNGWKLFRNLSDGDLIATLNSDSNELEYHLPTKTVTKPYKGELLAVEGYRVNFAVTPNHKLYVRKPKETTFGLIQASDVYGQRYIEFNKVCRWTGAEFEQVTIPKHFITWTCGKDKIQRNRIWPERKVQADAFFGFLGFYIAEGSIEYRNGKRPSGITIGQNEGSTLKEFISVLDALGFNYGIKDKGKFKIINIHSAQLAKYIHDWCGHGVNKRVPKLLKSASARQLRIFWKWYMLGDGCYNGFYCSTVSKTLADDLSEIALKIGYSTKVKEIPSKWHKSPNGQIYLCRTGYRINISRSYSTPTIRNSPWKKINYDGNVYCVEVPNHIIYVRRHGIPIWCGNCFPDIFNADLQAYLRDNGKRVWGSFDGEDLEIYRYEMKQLLAQLKLPVNETRHVQGTAELRDILQNEDDLWVKISGMRGLSESFHHDSWATSEQKIDELEHDLGGLKTTQEFVIEAPVVSKRELGYDGYNILGKFPSAATWGYEYKDKAGVSKFEKYAAFPKTVTEVNDKMVPTLQDCDYRGFFSTEIRVDKENRPFLIDVTARMASPMGEMYSEIFSNLADIMWFGAEGECLDPVPKAKYAAQLIFSSQFLVKNWLPIYIPIEHREWIKLYSSCKIGDTEHVIPSELNWEEIGSVVGLGNTLAEARKACEKNAQGIEAFDLKMDFDNLDKCIELAGAF